MSWPSVLETARLRLRRPTVEDAGDVTAYATDMEVTRYVSWPRHRSSADAVAFLAHAIAAFDAATELSWAITRRADDRLIGMIGLRPQGHRAELGYVLALPHWGQGFATEAARAMVAFVLTQPDVYRVWAVCDVDNVASARVLEKAGLEKEGRLRRWAILPNLGPEPRDCWCFARVK